MSPDLEAARRKVKEALTNLDAVIKQVVINCDHSIVADADSGTSEGHRMCTNCGLMENRRGPGYVVLRDSLVDPKVTKDFCWRKYTILLNNKDKTLILRGAKLEDILNEVRHGS